MEAKTDNSKNESYLA